MNKTTVILTSVFALIMLVAGCFVYSYNTIIKAEERVEARFAEVETELQRRYDLIPALVSTTQNHMTHEKKVLASVTEARSKLSGALTISETIEVSNELEGALSQLLALFNDYPELKTNAQLTLLINELSEAENRVATARSQYNEAVQMFNSKIRSFPISLMASMMEVEKRDYFQAQEESKSEL